MSKIRALALGVAAGLLAAAAQADVLLLDAIDQKVAQAPAMPDKGMTMASVEQRYGAPSGRRGAVGNPPITRWDYPGFVVYFEYRHVVHAVVKR